MKRITTSILIAALVMGCGNFGDLNTSPNASTTPLTSALLTNVLTQIGSTTSFITPGLYAQYASETLYTDASRYSQQDVDWSGLMAGPMYDLQNIIIINSDPATKTVAGLQGSNNNQIAVARILKAYYFSILTDRHGDMPYSQALDQKIPNPKYDTQQSIYQDIFKELKEAIAQFDNGASPTGDILFNGSIARWKTFANSWRLILALRVSKADATLGKTQFTDALTAGVISSTNDNVNITYPGNSVAFSNPWFGISGDYNVSTTIANLVNSTADPRRTAFGNAVGGVLTGVPPGLQRQDAIAYTSNPVNANHSLVLNNTFRQATSTLSLITYSDVLLARAEAAELTWTSENATQLYADGIKESMNKWGVYSDAAYNTYIANSSISLASGNRMQKINLQRWLGFYPNGPQGWSEWRRTNIPALSPSPSPVNTSGQIPVRFIYPTIEYGINNTNVLAAVANLEKGDTQDSRVWWDK
jgi:hypothetical protein